MIMGSVAVAVAVLQALLARRLDAGPATVAVIATCLMLGVPAAWLVAASGIAAIAWARGSVAGVGRPELSGAVGFLALLLHSLPELHPALAAAPLAASVPALALAGGLGVLSAAAQRGPRATWVFHHREVPITSASDAKPDEGDP